MTAKKPETTHFGYEEVGIAEKAKRVAAVFSSVAQKYDVMNDAMSLGLHRYWKAHTVATAQVRSGHCVLDIAGGTGDLTRLLSKRVGTSGQVVLADINADMLSAGRDKLIDAGIVQNVVYLQTDAERLPFTANQFDAITLAFGLRNMTRKEAALSALYEVLKPGGEVSILEFSKPVLPGLQPIYDAYSFQLLPRLGQWIANDADSYQYLAESIRKHPDQNTLKDMMEAAGFERCRYHNFAGGIVALHRGYKF